MISAARGVVDDARRDLQFALRSLRREPGVAAGIIATFALAIGANAAMVGLVARLMLAAPPGVSDPDAVARLKIDITTSNAAERDPAKARIPALWGRWPGSLAIIHSIRAA